MGVYGNRVRAKRQADANAFKQLQQKAEQELEAAKMTINYATKIMSGPASDQIKLDTYNNIYIPSMKKFNPNTPWKRKSVWDANSDKVYGQAQKVLNSDLPPDMQIKSMIDLGIQAQDLGVDLDTSKILGGIKQAGQAKTKREIQERRPQQQQLLKKIGTSELEQEEALQANIAGKPFQAPKTPTTLKSYVEQNVLTDLQAGNISFAEAATQVQNAEQLLNEDKNLSTLEVKDKIRKLDEDITKLGQNIFGDVMAKLTGQDAGDASPDTVARAKQTADIYRGELLSMLPVEERSQYVTSRGGIPTQSLESILGQ